MKWGCIRRACARSICSRIADTEFGSMSSEVNLRSATNFSIAATSTTPSTFLNSSALVPVSDRLDEQVAQSLALKQFA